MKSRYYDNNEILIGDGSTYPDTITAAALAALLDHGTLTGLSDDDHTQYLLIDGTRSMTGNLTMPNAGYVKFGTDFTGWRGSSSSGYVRGYIGVTAKLSLTASALSPVSSGGLTLGTSSTPWSHIWSANAVAHAFLNSSSAWSGGVTGAQIYKSDSDDFHFETYDSGDFLFRTTGATPPTQFVIAHLASAVNYAQVTGAITADYPQIYFTGSDSDVGGYIDAKGSGSIRFRTAGPSAVEQFRISHTASAVNYMQATGQATGSNQVVYLQAAGSDTHISLGIKPKGSNGCVIIGSGITVGSNPTRDLQVSAASASRSAIGVQASGNTSSERATMDFISLNGTALASLGQVADTSSGFAAFVSNSFNVYTGSGNWNGSTAHQFNVAHTASATRFITVTGSNGGNPTISTSAGALALGNGQLQWPASQSASSDANTLDDYEEGTWTPTVGGTSTYSNQVGNYTKIGDKYTLWWDFTISSIGTGSGSTVSGCPFTAGSTTNSKQGAGGCYWATWNGNFVYATPIDAGSATLQPYGATAAASTLSALSPFQNSARWLGQITMGDDT